MDSRKSLANTNIHVFIEKSRFLILFLLFQIKLQTEILEKLYTKTGSETPQLLFGESPSDFVLAVSSMPSLKPLNLIIWVQN